LTILNRTFAVREAVALLVEIVERVQGRRRHRWMVGDVELVALSAIAEVDSPLHGSVSPLRGAVQTFGSELGVPGFFERGIDWVEGSDRSAGQHHGAGVVAHGVGE
jgi:hypothetical protein